MSELYVPVPGVGNTISTPLKTVGASLRWCMTLNNYTSKDLNMIVLKVRSFCRYAIIAKEVGESGTPHLQGYIEFKTRRRPKGVFSMERIHWEKAKGSKECNINYCSKEDPKPYIFPEPYEPKIDNFYWWQDDIKKILNSNPDDRSVRWYWEGEGCKGKTTFAKWIYHNYPKVLALSGKSSDMKYGVVRYLELNSFLPNIILIDIPRSKAGFISYTGIEEIKDMFFFCGKYEGSMVSGPSPHVICFSNYEPEFEKMSSDRWKVVHINEQR